MCFKWVFDFLALIFTLSFFVKIKLYSRISQNFPISFMKNRIEFYQITNTSSIANDLDKWKITRLLLMFYFFYSYKYFKSNSNRFVGLILMFIKVKFFIGIVILINNKLDTDKETFFIFIVSSVLFVNRTSLNASSPWYSQFKIPN